ncbi:MAG: hypothetical protein KUL88_06540 [Rhizobium sp.]|nr:hypothetical protein [Rhizobium sp.]
MDKFSLWRLTVFELDDGGNRAHVSLHNSPSRDGRETNMFQAIRHYRLHTGLAPQQALAPLLRLVRRVLTPRNRLGDDLPDSLKRTLACRWIDCRGTGRTPTGLTVTVVATGCGLVRCDRFIFWNKGMQDIADRLIPALHALIQRGQQSR